MSFIQLTTFVAAPQERVFDLSRSVDLHKHSMSKYEEKIMKGTMTGLMNLQDEVTWKAKHLWKERVLRIRVTELRRPDYFKDEQVDGDFLSMKHEHHFKPIENGTIMIDQFHYAVKHGVLGKLVNGLFLEKYLKRLLGERNATIKRMAESNQWKQYLEK
jgi:ligand-binding SRPBCC domain-containing protein